MNTKRMTNKEIEEHNAQVEVNRKVVVDLWSKLGRKPTIEEIKEALNVESK